MATTLCRTSCRIMPGFTGPITGPACTSPVSSPWLWVSVDNSTVRVAVGCRIPFHPTNASRWPRGRRRAPGERPYAHLNCDKTSHFSRPNAQLVTLPCPRCHNKSHSIHSPAHLVAASWNCSSATTPQRSLSVRMTILNLFRIGRHLRRSAHYRLLRSRSFQDWLAVTGV